MNIFLIGVGNNGFLVLTEVFKRLEFIFSLVNLEMLSSIGDFKCWLFLEVFALDFLKF